MCGVSGRHKDVPSGNSRRACEPAALFGGRTVRAAFFWLLFFAVQRKVTRATRETLCSDTRAKAQRAQSKIKGAPPQSSPALRAREEARAGARSKWIPAF